MKKGFVIAALLCLLIAAGCSSGSESTADSFEVDTFSDKDRCMRKKEDSKAEVCYGMDRADAEKVVGDPDDENGIFTNYDSGVKLFYRDQKVVGIGLLEGSQGKYETARGAEVGVSFDTVKQLYGEKYAIQISERNLDYAYDTATKKFLSEVESGSKNQLESEPIHLFSMMLGNDDNVSMLLLIDRKMAVFMN